MNSLEKAMNNLKESKKKESDKLAKLVEGQNKKKLTEGKEEYNKEEILKELKNTDDLEKMKSYIDSLPDSELKDRLTKCYDYFMMIAEQDGKYDRVGWNVYAMAKKYFNKPDKKEVKKLKESGNINELKNILKSEFEDDIEDEEDLPEDIDTYVSYFMEDFDNEYGLDEDTYDELYKYLYNLASSYFDEIFEESSNKNETLKESEILSNESKKALQNEIDTWVKQLGLEATEELIDEDPYGEDGIMSDDNIYDIVPELEDDEDGEVEEAIVKFIRNDFKTRYSK